MPGDSLSTTSSNGKENVETLSQALNTYFAEKYLRPKIAMDLGRNDPKNIVQVELHDVKFICTRCARNWNVRVCTFLGCYCQRGDSFKLNHKCEVVTDEEHIVCHNNAADEWESELSINAEYSVDDHKDWCAENNFGLNPAFLSTSKIRYDSGLHMPCVIAHDILLCFR